MTQPPSLPVVSPVRALTVALIWLVSVGMALPKVTYIQFSSGCTWSVGRAQWLGFLVPAFLVYYVAPLLCIAAHCGAVVLRLRRRRLAVGGGAGGGGAAPSADRRNRKATALLVASTLAFAVSWLPYYALEFVNVFSPHVCSAASPTGPTGSAPCPGSPNASSPFSSPSPSYFTPVPVPGQGVSLLWEVASLTAILLVCLAPCWNPPLYFLLSRPALRELRGLLPRWRGGGGGGGGDEGKKAARSWRVAPALRSPPPPLRPSPPVPRPPSAHESSR
ncbi:hypothetical protein NHX12_005074 [Muraenolepis orangiensis]|uniref:G-protein coupled receptors family 1 profile domain-containing protein n=1 Tax=Muraenolepis orangiensis TaxID=630683 RepID=A0A9Q0DY05_9TELE|nr:hypothetical protein NHX12_005074 [Muraenolepis orangiensis]